MIPTTEIPQSRVDLQILQSLRRITRAVDLHSKKLSQQFHLTGPQLVCLLTVLDKEPISVASLAKEVYLSPSTVVGIVDRLEAKGYIARHRHPKDRRALELRMTEQGSRFCQMAPSPLQDSLAQSLALLPSQELESIATALGKVVELMEAQTLEVPPVLVSVSSTSVV